jgi:hypothetical protein
MQRYKNGRKITKKWHNNTLPGSERLLPSLSLSGPHFYSNRENRMNQKEKIELPNPFLFETGVQINTARDWERRRKEICNLIVEIEYGGLPPTPSSTWHEELHSSTVEALDGASFKSLRVVTGPGRRFSFLLYLLIPPGDGPFPVVLTGDTCWRYVTDEVAAEVVRRGHILAQFNRVEIVPDAYNSDRVTGLYRVYTEGTYGALAAWAWGYHRCVDVLVGMDFVDASRIAVIGHSRGGKTVLLAGATDERIALTCANNSGSGGAGCYRWQGPESETLADTIRTIPYWFGPRLKQFIGRETKLPFDQHFLKALIAPRALLTTEALGDLWANPTGTWQTYLAAKEVYRFLGAEKQIGIWYREGGHDHGTADWRVFLDFMEWQFQGCKSEYAFDTNPYPDLQRAFSWLAPCKGTDGEHL